MQIIARAFSVRESVDRCSFHARMGYVCFDLLHHRSGTYQLTTATTDFASLEKCSAAGQGIEATLGLKNPNNEQNGWRSAGQPDHFDDH